MPAVLFVCTANRFRSPLAEAAFKKCLEDDGCRMGWEVASAGIWTESGLPIFPTALKAAKEIGLKVGTHRTQPITPELLSRSNVVIVMQASQRESIQIEFPQAAGKIFLLSEIVDGIPYDIPDPFDTEDSHQELAEEICGLVKRGYKKIIDLARERERDLQ
jgi:protein-tyrosine phosphatase